MPEVEDRPERLFSRDEYHAMVDSGILRETDRVELINGRIVTMMPIGPWHAASNARISDRLHDAYGKSALIVMGNPIGMDNKSEPQPDVAVLRRSPDYYATSHPQAKDVLLLIEISDSTRTFDLGTKRDLYAAHEIKEYWVVDGVRKCIHVFRNPKDGVYLESRIYQPGESIPLPECDATLPVNEAGVQ